jgi:RNA polymerase sigma factor (sigma-70 family)
MHAGILDRGVPMRTIIRHLRRVVLLQAGDNPTDGQLLESFLTRRDEAAFEALLRRHGPMVLGVCRRLLGNFDDADDAFQATFLVLVRKGASIRPRDLVGNWLYGVAYRTARKARAMKAKRREKERKAGEMPRLEPPADGAQEELLARLDYELSRLPDKYRVPVVFCELEGRSRKEVARLLGVPEGTLSWRLAQAKKMLAKRLSRNRAELSVSAVAAVLSPEAVSATLRSSTVEAVLTAGAVPAQVLALTQGVMKAMLLTKLKITACFAALMLLAGVGATGLTYRVAAQQPKQGTGDGAVLVSGPQADELEALRLEIEALRKSLQATRERVKTLEDEVRGLKGQGGKQMPQGGDAMMQMMGSGMKAKGDGMMRRGKGGPQGAGDAPKGNIRPTDPLADAEAALKVLRANPGEKHATEILERALKQLKEREKVQPSPEDNSGAKR